MTKKLVFVFLLITAASSLLSIKQALVISAFDEGEEQQKIAQLDDEITEYEALYLKAIFSNAVPEGFVAVYAPQYIEAGSAVAQR